MVHRITSKHAALLAMFVLSVVPNAHGQKLLISELVVQPTTAEFIEVYNPNSTVVALDDVYLSDMTTYHLISGGVSPTASDFVVQFPPGVIIAAQSVVVVALESATSFSSNYGVLPDFDLDLSDSGAPAMIGSYGGSSGLTNSDEVVVLFHWDGVTDLVSDLDYVLYGNTSDAVDKTGVVVGDSTYAHDTPAGSQDFAAAPTAGEAVRRIDATEGTQVQSGGNGVLEGNETSENLSVTFAVTTQPTPGSVSFSLPNIIFTDGFEDRIRLVISEYVEGSSNNKAIELLNMGNVAVDLVTAQCSLDYYSTPADVHTEVTLQVDLVGTIQPNATFTLCQSNIVVFPAGQCDQLNSDPGWFNGDDPVELRCANASQDWLGQIGVDIDFAQNQTLRRKCSVSTGDTVGDDVFDSSIEWGRLPTDDVSGLGNHSPVFPTTASSPKTLAIEAIDISNQRIRLRNFSAEKVTVTNEWRLCNFPRYESFTPTDVVIVAGASVTFDIPSGLGLSIEENWGLGVYMDSNFTNADSMMDFLQVNGAGTVRESVAATAGVWIAGEFITLNASDGGLVLMEGGSSFSASGYATFNRVCALP